MELLLLPTTLLTTTIALLLWLLWPEEKQEQAMQYKMMTDEDEELTLLKKENDEDEDEEKHLYVKTNMRTGENLLQYHKYCYYQHTSAESAHSTDVTDVEKESSKQEIEVSEDQKETNEEVKEILVEEETVEDEKDAFVVGPVFRWPDDAALLTGRGKVSGAVRARLAGAGILRSDPPARTGTGAELAGRARQTGLQLGRRAVRLIWDSHTVGKYSSSRTVGGHSRSPWARQQLHTPVGAA